MLSHHRACWKIYFTFSAMIYHVLQHESFNFTSKCLLPRGATEQVEFLPNFGVNDTRATIGLTATFFKKFLKTFLADTCPILGPLIPLFWISGDISSGFQSQSGLPYLHCGGERNVHSLRSTSGATHCQPLDGKHCGATTGNLAFSVKNKNWGKGDYHNIYLVI